MSYISKFKYNTAYSNTDIAELMSIITTEGITSSITSPNHFFSNLINSGVASSDDRCNVTLSGSTATIGTGCVIMHDGSYIVITEPEQLILPSESEKCYVYIEEIETGNNVPKCSVLLPEKTDSYVPLAEIEGGIVTDTRIWCQAKVPLSANSRVTQPATVNWRVPRNLMEFSLAAEIPLTNTGFAKIFVTTNGNVDFNTVCGIWDRQSGQFSYAYAKVADYTFVKNSDEMIVDKSNISEYKIKFEVSGSVLKIYADARTSHAGTGYISGTLDIELI